MGLFFAQKMHLRIPNLVRLVFLAGQASHWNPIRPIARPDTGNRCFFLRLLQFLPRIPRIGGWPTHYRAICATAALLSPLFLGGGLYLLLPFDENHGAMSVGMGRLSAHPSFNGKRKQKNFILLFHYFHTISAGRAVLV